MVRMQSGSAYCGIKSMWLRCSTLTFVNKLREALGTRQVQGAAGLASMPVSTRDKQ